MTTPLATVAAPAGKAASGPAIATTAERVASVDVLRGIAITLMIFVNDAAGIAGAPGWLKHAGMRDDAMTLPDVVFPAFLFIAGMSIPLALARAQSAAQGRWPIVRKVIGRTVALLVMGILMVNADEFSPWPRGCWAVCAYAAMLLSFAVVPRAPGPGRRAWTWLRRLGWAALVVLALAYVTPATAGDPVPHRLVLGPLFHPADTVWLRHSWWGILGLIGWAYLVGSLVYLFCGRRREWLVGATALLTLMYVAANADYPARLAQRPWLDWVRGAIGSIDAVIGAIGHHVSLGESLGSLAAITVAGCCLGSLLTPGSDVGSPRARLRWAAGFLGGLLAAAVLLDPLYGLNKIRATPSWCLLCAALTTGAWMLLYWLIDLRGHRRWTRVFQPAGANPLLAYILHPLLYLIAGVATLPLGFYRNPGWPLAVNLLGSALMALVVVQLTGLLARTGYRLKA